MPWRPSRTPKPKPSSDRQTPSLVDCPRCGRDYVNPVVWHNLDDGSWWMLLRCAQCSDVRDVVVDEAAADRFDRDLDVGLGVIVRELDRLERERLATEAETFVTALELDLICADDFAR